MSSEEELIDVAEDSDFDDGWNDTNQDFKNRDSKVASFFRKANNYYDKPFFGGIDRCLYPNGEVKVRWSFSTLFNLILSHPFAILFVICSFILIDLLYIFVLPPITWRGWFTIVTFVIGFGFMISDVVSPTFVFLWMIGLYCVTDTVTIQQALEGFCNSSVATIALLFCIAGALEGNGLMHYISKYLIGKSTSVVIGLTKLLFPVCAVSGFINNTPLVALLIPACQIWSQRSGISMSKMLMPLSFAAILGGTLTSIGTSTNLVIVGLAKDLYPNVTIGFFDVGYAGLPAAIVGLIYIILFAKFLPNRKSIGYQYLQNPKVIKTTNINFHTCSNLILINYRNLFLLLLLMKN